MEALFARTARASATCPRLVNDVPSSLSWNPFNAFPKIMQTREDSQTIQMFPAVAAGVSQSVLHASPPPLRAAVDRRGAQR